MKRHWSVWGYRTACGLHLDNSKHLTRDDRAVTCGNCRRTGVLR